MNRKVLHGIELEVTRDHPVLGTVELDLVDRAQEAPGIDAALELGMIDRDGDGVFVVAVDHARHAALATLRPGGPLAASRGPPPLQLLDGRHSGILLYWMTK